MADCEGAHVPGMQDHQTQREHRFRLLYEAYYRPVRAYAVRRLGPAEDAADVVADVFTTAWRRIDQIPPAPEDRLWLYGVARRVLAGRHRSARRRQNLAARLRADHGLPASDLPGARDTTRDLVLDALDRLPPAEREALQLVLWEELSHAEAAQVLGCSANAVAIRVHRAKGRLREDLSRPPRRPDRAPTPGPRSPARLNRS